MINEIRNKLKSKTVKTLAENFVSLSLLKVVSLITPLITLPYLSRVIGTDGFGAIAFASAIMVFVETITDWGFNYTATRDVAVARKSNDIDRISSIFSEVIMSKICLMVLCFIILCISIHVIPTFRQYRLLLLFTFLYIPGHIMFPEWLFQAFEQMKYITILNVSSKLLFTVLIFIVIREKSDYIYQPLLTACGFFMSGLIALYVIHQRFNVRFVMPSIRAMTTRLNESTNMFISLILPNFYSNFSTVILKTYYGETATGIYDAGKRLHVMVEQISQILSRVFFPFLARDIQKHKSYVVISGTVCMMSSILLFFGADFFISLFYSSEFAPAVIVARIFALGPIGLFLMNTYGVNYLVVIKKEKVLRNIIIFCSIGGCLLSWIITRKYGYIGAPVTLVSVWMVRGLATYVMAKKEMRK